MNIKHSLLSVALATCLATVSAPADATGTPSRYVVELAAGADLDRVSSVLDSHGINVVRKFEHPQVPTLAVDVDLSNLPDVELLRYQLPEVTSYYRDVPRFTLALPPTPIEDIEVDGEIVPWGIQAVDSIGVPYGGGRKVCIIDTGYKLGHPDLQMERVDGIDRGAGPWDDSDGEGLHFHGTHVAGTISAKGGNGEGVIGVIPSGDLDLFIVRAFNEAGSLVYATDLAGAMLDCADAGANVINMSLGGMFASKVGDRVTRQIYNRGVLLIASSGNGNTYGGLQPRNDFATHSYPASYDAVMAVAAMNNNLERASFSQYTAKVEITAPGVDVLSTSVEEQDLIYELSSGTSMSAPHVAGVAALVWSNHKECTNTQIRNALKASALDIGAPGYDYQNGHGLVQAQAAMDYLAANPCKGSRRAKRPSR